MADRYTKKEAQGTLTAILNLRKEGKSAKNIADHLNARGFKTSTGKEWNVNRVHAYFHANKRKVAKVAPRTTKKIVQKPAYLTDVISKNTVVTILTDPRMNDGQRLKVLTTYVGIQ